MKTPRSTPLLFMLAFASCDSDVGGSASTDQPTVVGATTDAAATNTAGSMPDAAKSADTVAVDPLRQQAKMQRPHASAKHPPQPDARADGDKRTGQMRAEHTYAIGSLQRRYMSGRSPDKSVCNTTGDGYYLWEDTKDVCGCPDVPRTRLDAPIQSPPPATADAAVAQPAPPRDASPPNFPTFLATDAAPIDAPRPNVSPDTSAPPEPNFPSSLPGPKTPDAQLVANVTPDAALPQPRLDCGCQEPDVAPIPPAIIADALPPDTTPIALQPDAGAPDVIVPDAMPDSTPDMLPDLVPIDALSPPDTECTGGTTITLSPTPIPTPPIEEHCYTTDRLLGRSRMPARRVHGGVVGESSPERYRAQRQLRRCPGRNRFMAGP